MISKRDKALIYHQRIVYLVSTDFAHADSFSWETCFLAQLIAKGISKSVKKLSKDYWRQTALLMESSKDCLRKNKNFVVWWGQRV